MNIQQLLIRQATVVRRLYFVCTRYYHNCWQRQWIFFFSGFVPGFDTTDLDNLLYILDRHVGLGANSVIFL